MILPLFYTFKIIRKADLTMKNIYIALIIIVYQVSVLLVYDLDLS